MLAVDALLTAALTACLACADGHRYWPCAVLAPVGGLACCLAGDGILDACADRCESDRLRTGSDVGHIRWLVDSARGGAAAVRSIPVRSPGQWASGASCRHSARGSPLPLPMAWRATWVAPAS